MEGKAVKVQTRTESGKNASYRLRKAGFIPAVVYSHGQVENIQVDGKDFFDLFHGHVSESVIFALNYTDKNESKSAYVKDYQADPVTDEVRHLDLYLVKTGEKIKTRVLLEIVGTPKGEKLGGMLEVSVHEIEVECLPKDLPEKIQVDVTELLVDDSIHAKDLNLGEGIKLTSNGDTVVAAVHALRVSKDEDAEEVEEEATEE
jgi:large subunit ribosomal protein L25